MTDGLIEGHCDCGGVRWTFRGLPDHLTACNCGFCRRAGALWAYGDETTVAIEGETVPYLRGDRTLAFHHCPTCGAVTHWQALAPRTPGGPLRRAVNMRIADPSRIAHLPIRRLDGAGTWRSLTEGEQAAVPFLPL